MLLGLEREAGTRGGHSVLLPNWPSVEVTILCQQPHEYLDVWAPQKRTCGTHFGATKEPASMFLTPVPESRRMSSSFTGSGILVFSFCKPSRGPTSTMRTSPARRRALVAKLLRKHWHANFCPFLKTELLWDIVK